MKEWKTRELSIWEIVWRAVGGSLREYWVAAMMTECACGVVMSEEGFEDICMFIGQRADRMHMDECGRSRGARR